MGKLKTQRLAEAEGKLEEVEQRRDSLRSAESKPQVGSACRWEALPAEVLSAVLKYTLTRGCLEWAALWSSDGPFDPQRGRLDGSAG